MAPVMATSLLSTGSDESFGVSHELISQLHSLSLGSRGHATSLLAAKCAPGFVCASRISSFPAGHDGVYHHKSGLRFLEPDDQHKYRDWFNTYEVGCPAKGTVTPSGACKDNGTGDQGYCYSTGGFEAGPHGPCSDEGSCICVKAGTPTGGLLNQKHVFNKDGEEAVEGTFEVEPPSKCHDCEQLSDHPWECSTCPNCEFKEKSFGGRRLERCWDKDAGGNTDRSEGPSREYLHGEKTQKKALTMIPHYEMYDPAQKFTPSVDEGSTEAFEEQEADAAAGPKMPNTDMGEPLSRGSWIERYKEAAPRVQEFLDQVALKLKKEWAPKAMNLQCDPVNGSKDILAKGGGLFRKIDQAESLQRACLKIQETARKISPGPFSGLAADGKHDMSCVRHDGIQGNEGAPEHECQDLNCYTSDSDFRKSLEQVHIRNEQCAEHWDDSMKQLGDPKASSMTLFPLAATCYKDGPCCTRRCRSRHRELQQFLFLS
eukprot:TRINITY_DN40125_c0_g1_i1.p1 TRINITY_DN40125_c0_g1~~TRINITY_DN40125_c0_g1_i1.p1  ORF type:complete len:498 (+),score=89.20 TRINITY_DN40125_c0_g1_i1:39-1496(+)